jgi:hypothetical protein
MLRLLFGPIAERTTYPVHRRYMRTVRGSGTNVSHGAATEGRNSGVLPRIMRFIGHADAIDLQTGTN